MIVSKEYLYLQSVKPKYEKINEVVIRRHATVAPLFLHLSGHTGTHKKITAASGLIKVFIHTRPEYIYHFKLHSKLYGYNHHLLYVTFTHDEFSDKQLCILVVLQNSLPMLDEKYN